MCSPTLGSIATTARKLISWLTAQVLSRGLKSLLSPFQWTLAVSSEIDFRAGWQRSQEVDELWVWLKFHHYSFSNKLALLTYTWDLGDGSSPIAGQTINHTYANGYSARLSSLLSKIAKSIVGDRIL